MPNSLSLLLACSLIIISAPSSIAQSPAKGQFEVVGSVATISGMYLVHSVNSDDQAPEDCYGETLDYMLSGKYFVGSRIALGLDVDYQALNITTNSYRAFESFTGIQKMLTLAPTITGIYVKTNSFQFYCIYGIGLQFYKNHYTYHTGSDLNILNSDIVPNFNATPLGLRFGRKFAWHLEFGFGYRGLLNTGFNYSFGKTHTHPPGS